MKSVATSILFLTTIALVASDGSVDMTKFSIRCNAKWTDFTNTVVQLLVSGKICTHQQAINLLKTFGIRGTGEFSDFAAGVTYTSTMVEVFGGDLNSANQFIIAIKQLIKERENCATWQTSAPAKCADQTTDFLEILVKLTVGNQLITAQNATDLAVQFGATLTIPRDETTPTSPEFGCMQKQYDFKKLCESQYGGIADGSRCFFIPDVAPTTWDNAFAVCKNRSAILAAVLTSSEMNKISTILRARYGDLYVFTSGKRITPSTAEPGGACSISRNSTFVFNNATDYNPLLVYGNTWFRYRKCEDAGSPSEQCIVIWTFLTLYGDVQCSGPWMTKPLCQFSGPSQQYVRVDKVCLAETAIVETSVTSANDCATSCNQYSWCRSFNLINTSKCQLFPWWIEDKPNTSVNSPDCVHYTYFP